MELPDLVEPAVEFSSRILSVPLSPKIITRHYEIRTIEIVLLRATDMSGESGYATLWCFGLPQARVLTQILEYLTPFVFRMQSTSVTSILSELRREINFFGFKGVSVFGFSAIDMALTDLACRQQQRSLGEILGRRRSTIPTYWSGLFGNQPLDEILDEVDQKLDEGFHALKLRTGNPSIKEDLRRIEAVLERIPNNVTLMLDAVQSWTLDQALDAVHQLEGMPIHWLEDPLVHTDYAGLTKLVETSSIPIATGENEYLSEGFEQLFTSGTPYLLADLERVGGIHEWQKVASRAREHGTILTPHVFPHIALQLCSTLDQSETWIEYIPWWNPLTSEPLQISDGCLIVPNTIGVGLNLDQDRVEAFATTPWVRLTE